MERYALKQLIDWKNEKNHKPLILQGARQVGKTWLMKEFGRRFYKNIAYINFDESKSNCDIFENDYDISRIVQSLEILNGNRIFEEFRGAITEQYVMQQLKTIKNLPIFYWTNETSRAEIDFVVQVNESIVPIEVKASINLQAKSLKSYMDKYKPECALRTSMADYKTNNVLFDIPLYSIAQHIKTRQKAN